MLRRSSRQCPEGTDEQRPDPTVDVIAWIMDIAEAPTVVLDLPGEPGAHARVEHANPLEVPR